MLHASGIECKMPSKGLLACDLIGTKSTNSQLDHNPPRSIIAETRWVNEIFPLD